MLNIMKHEDTFEDFKSKTEITVNGDRIKLISVYQRKSGENEVNGFLTVMDGKSYQTKTEADFKEWLRKKIDNIPSIEKLEKKYSEETGKDSDKSNIRIANNLLHPYRQLQEMILLCIPIDVELIKNTYINERKRWLKDVGVLPNYSDIVRLYPNGLWWAPALSIDFKQGVKVK